MARTSIPATRYWARPAPTAILFYTDGMPSNALRVALKAAGFVYQKATTREEDLYGHGWLGLAGGLAGKIDTDALLAAPAARPERDASKSGGSSDPFAAVNATFDSDEASAPAPAKASERKRKSA